MLNNTAKVERSSDSLGILDLLLSTSFFLSFFLALLCVLFSEIYLRYIASGRAESKRVKLYRNL